MEFSIYLSRITKIENVDNEYVEKEALSVCPVFCIQIAWASAIDKWMYTLLDISTGDNGKQIWSKPTDRFVWGAALGLGRMERYANHLEKVGVGGETRHRVVFGLARDATHVDELRLVVEPNWLQRWFPAYKNTKKYQFIFKIKHTDYAIDSRNKWNREKWKIYVSSIEVV